MASESLDYIECAGCKKYVRRTVTKPEKYRKHKNDHTDEPCDYGGTEVPEEVLCRLESTAPTATSERTASSAKSSPDHAAPTAESATSTAESSSDPPPSDASTSATAEPALTDVDSYLAQLDETVTAQQTSYRERVDAKISTHFSQPAQEPAEQPTLFSQPAGAKSEEPVVEMSAMAQNLTGRLKELFYAYDNRRTNDNRSAQTTMGPSEMGTPCDRRLALSLMRMPPVNPGGDGWAAFVGTCIHAGLEQMFMWADAGTGRFAVEQRLTFDHDIVPKGTADLIDRTLFMLDDHKCQGRWSRNKLKTTGPSKTYRVQAHVYAKGARAKGERIDYVAIISWPRDEATLDDLYVWMEPYNPAIADEAFARVDEIHSEAAAREQRIMDLYPGADELEIKARVGMEFTIADDCRFCPFYLPNTRDPLRGCNGKR